MLFGRKIALSISIFFSVIGLILFATPSKVVAADFTLDRDDFTAGSWSKTQSEIGNNEIVLAPNANIGAVSIKYPDKIVSLGSTYTADENYVYMLRGSADNTFYRYNPLTNTWKTLANSPRGAYYGADIEYLNGYIYAFVGGYQSAFLRYDIAQDKWEFLKDYPELVYQGAAISTDGTNIYALSSNGTQSFYRYNLDANTWTSMPGTPGAMRGGSDLVYKDGFFYTPRGNSTNNMYRFNVAGNSWQTMANVPAVLLDDMDITISGNYIYVSRQYNTTDFYRYNITGNSWETLAAAPMTARYAGVVKSPIENIIYFFRGNGDYRIWKYDVATNKFLGLTEMPASTGTSTGSEMFYYNNAVYVVRGASTTNFYKYDLTTNIWSNLAAIPGTITEDTRGTVAGAYIYLFRGSNTNAFYRYTIATDTWVSLANAPATVRFGGAIAYDGVNTLYATRGASTLEFWKYTISTDTWDITPVDMPAGAFASYGSTLNFIGNQIYYNVGGGIKKMYRYSVAGNNWTQLSDPPMITHAGTEGVYDGDDAIIWLETNHSKTIWKYIISQDKWIELTYVQPYIPYEYGFTSGATITTDGSNNFYFVYGGSRQEFFQLTLDANDYPGYGNWVSKAYDLGYVSSWDNISSTINTPGNSSLVISTRTSSDGINWSTWEAVTGNSINSAEQRYVQFKIELYSTSDYTQTPKFTKLAVSYTGDQNPPSAPNSVEAYSSEIGGEVLVDGQSYKYTSPSFTLAAATDNESDIKGYYLYWGNNNSADPVVSGIFQTASIFTPNTSPVSGPNYLRVVSEDTNGNKSTATTLFTYDYFGIAPYQSTTVTAADFNGTAVNTLLSPSNLKLTSNSTGIWKETRLAYPTVGFSFGSKTVAYVEETNKMYILQGAGLQFLQYDLTIDTWTFLANAPAGVSYGGGVIEGPDGYLYAMRGGNTTEFWRYDIASNTWSTEVAQIPLTIGYGGSLVYDGNQYIYVLRGNSSDTFWRYDTAQDTWETLARTNFGLPNLVATNAVSIGGDIVMDQANGLIYAIQGNTWAGLSIYNTNTDSWSPQPLLPALPYYGASIVLDGEGGLYFTPGNSMIDFYKADLENYEWRKVSDVPLAMYYGGSMLRVGDFIYMIRGSGSANFYKYDIKKDSWLLPYRSLFSRIFEGATILNYNVGADIEMGNDNNYYIMRGNFSDEFIRWNSETGEKSTLAKLPNASSYGAAFAIDNGNNKLYYASGTTENRFYVYDIPTNTWSTITTDPLPQVANTGAHLVYDGSRYIYFSRAGGTLNFYRYDTQGTAGSRWSNLANLPLSTNYGAELLIKDGFIYSMRGSNVNPNPLFRYNIATNVWSTLASAPVAVYQDGFLLDGHNGYLYLAAATNTNLFYRYSLDLNSWERITNIPAQVAAGGSGESNGSDTFYVIAGGATNSYQDGLYSYIVPTSNSSFNFEGSYQTESYDLTSVYRWSGLDAVQATPKNTTIKIYTSTSTDNINWSEWSTVSRKQSEDTSDSYKINSPSARYIKLKFEFTSADGLYTPSISEFTINYLQDINAPTNPNTAGLTVTDSQNVAVVSDIWDNDSGLTLNWPDAEDTYGASDGAGSSEVAGYYAYWGTDPDALPSIDGTYIETSIYNPMQYVDGSTYYFKLQTVDSAGNISADSWSPFIYKYDNSAPTVPTTLTADPSQYTTVNNFAFNWIASTSTGSAVSNYCYITGATSGTYSEEQCITATTIADVPSYKVGVNTFKVRAKDEAGNLSAYISGSYYYVDAENSPAPPTNLTVTPTSSTSNSFGFTWNPPLSGTYFGSQSNLSYLYSVNALPTQYSTSQTSLTYLNPGAYATLPGENIFYIVTKDEAGNVNYNDYVSVSFNANTVAPGIPVNMEVADVSVKNTSSWRLALSWDEPQDLGSGVAGYQIHRSIDGVTFYFHSYTTAASLVDSKLIQMTYYYKVRACDSTSNCGAFSEIVSLYPDGRYTAPAELIIAPVVSDISPRKATVSWITNRPSDSKVAFGIEPGVYFDEEVGNSDQVVDHTLNINNLKPGTKYYYIVKWTDEDGNTGVSVEADFTTSPPPTIEEPIVKRVSLNNALISFRIKDSIKVKINYGESTAFGGVVETYTGTAAGSYDVELSGLKDGTKYFYKINTFDVDGTEYEGETHSFETLPRPQILDPKIFQVAGVSKNTLLVQWSSNTAVTSVVSYYPSISPELVKDEINVSYKQGVHRMVLIDLLPNTPYTIQISGRDFIGNEALSNDIVFTTASDTRPPQIFDFDVTSELVGVGTEATAQLVVTYRTDEPSSSQVEFGEGTGTTYSQKTQEDTNLSTTHVLIVSGLVPSKVYHLRAISDDEAGNSGYSIDKVVVTTSATESAFDLVIRNLTSIFAY